MPVTAKLSRKFYERLGDEVAGELVDWFNAVDLTYQTQLKEINEMNWERFKATLQAECAAIREELRGEFRAGLADVRGELAGLRAEMNSALSAAGSEQRSDIAKLRIEMGAMRGDLLKWMFIYWTGSIVALGGLAVAIVTLGQR